MAMEDTDFCEQCGLLCEVIDSGEASTCCVCAGDVLDLCLMCVDRDEDGSGEGAEAGP